MEFVEYAPATLKEIADKFHIDECLPTNGREVILLDISHLDVPAIGKDAIQSKLASIQNLFPDQTKVIHTTDSLSDHLLDAKTIILVMPSSGYTPEDMHALKTFGQVGGRILLVWLDAEPQIPSHIVTTVII